MMMVMLRGWVGTEEGFVLAGLGAPHFPDGLEWSGGFCPMQYRGRNIPDRDNDVSCVTIQLDAFFQGRML